MTDTRPDCSGRCEPEDCNMPDCKLCWPAPRYIATHGGTRIQREWQTVREIEVEPLETLRAWLVGNDPNGDYSDNEAHGPLTHSEACLLVADQSDLRVSDH